MAFAKNMIKLLLQSFTFLLLASCSLTQRINVQNVGLKTAVIFDHPNSPVETSSIVPGDSCDYVSADCTTFSISIFVASYSAKGSQVKDSIVVDGIRYSLPSKYVGNLREWVDLSWFKQTSNLIKPSIYIASGETPIFKYDGVEEKLMLTIKTEKSIEQCK